MILRCFVFLAALFIASVNADVVRADTMDQASVNAMLSAYDAAVVNRDDQTIASLLSDDVRISLDANDQHYSHTKASFLDAMRKGWTQAQNYSYKHTNKQISIVDATHATVSSDVFESFTVDSKNINVQNKINTQIELRGDKLKITKTDGVMVNPEQDAAK
jgi:ketosteroid isomerase-like protein